MGTNIITDAASALEKKAIRTRQELGNKRDRVFEFYNNGKKEKPGEPSPYLQFDDKESQKYNAAIDHFSALKINAPTIATGTANAALAARDRLMIDMGSLLSEEKIQELYQGTETANPQSITQINIANLSEAERYNYLSEIRKASTKLSKIVKNPATFDSDIENYLKQNPNDADVQAAYNLYSGKSKDLNLMATFTDVDGKRNANKNVMRDMVFAERNAKANTDAFYATENAKRISEEVESDLELLATKEYFNKKNKVPTQSHSSLPASPKSPDLSIPKKKEEKEPQEIIPHKRIKQEKVDFDWFDIEKNTTKKAINKLVGVGENIADTFVEGTKKGIQQATIATNKRVLDEEVQSILNKQTDKYAVREINTAKTLLQKLRGNATTVEQYVKAKKDAGEQYPALKPYLQDAEKVLEAEEEKKNLLIGGLYDKKLDIVKRAATVHEGGKKITWDYTKLDDTGLIEEAKKIWKEQGFTDAEWLDYSRETVGLMAGLQLMAMVPEALVTHDFKAGREVFKKMEGQSPEDYLPPALANIFKDSDKLELFNALMSQIDEVRRLKNFAKNYSPTVNVARENWSWWDEVLNKTTGLGRGFLEGVSGTATSLLYGRNTAGKDIMSNIIDENAETFKWLNIGSMSDGDARNMTTNQINMLAENKLIDPEAWKKAVEAGDTSAMWEGVANGTGHILWDMVGPGKLGGKIASKALKSMKNINAQVKAVEAARKIDPIIYESGVGLKLKDKLSIILNPANMRKETIFNNLGMKSLAETYSPGNSVIHTIGFMTASHLANGNPYASPDEIAQTIKNGAILGAMTGYLGGFFAETAKNLGAMKLVLKSGGRSTPEMIKRLQTLANQAYVGSQLFAMPASTVITNLANGMEWDHDFWRETIQGALITMPGIVRSGRAYVAQKPFDRIRKVDKIIRTEYDREKILNDASPLEGKDVAYIQAKDDKIIVEEFPGMKESLLEQAGKQKTDKLLIKDIPVNKETTKNLTKLQEESFELLQKMYPDMEIEVTDFPDAKKNAPAYYSAKENKIYINRKIETTLRKSRGESTATNAMNFILHEVTHPELLRLYNEVPEARKELDALYDNFVRVFRENRGYEKIYESNNPDLIALFEEFVDENTGFINTDQITKEEFFATLNTPGAIDFINFVNNIGAVDGKTGIAKKFTEIKNKFLPADSFSRQLGNILQKNMTETPVRVGKRIFEEESIYSENEAVRPIANVTPEAKAATDVIEKSKQIVENDIIANKNKISEEKPYDQKAKDREIMKQIREDARRALEKAKEKKLINEIKANLEKKIEEHKVKQLFEEIKTNLLSNIEKAKEKKLIDEIRTNLEKKALEDKAKQLFEKARQNKLTDELRKEAIEKREINQNQKRVETNLKPFINPETGQIEFKEIKAIPENTDFRGQVEELKIPAFKIAEAIEDISKTPSKAKIKNAHKAISEQLDLLTNKDYGQISEDIHSLTYNFLNKGLTVEEFRTALENYQPMPLLPLERESLHFLKEQDRYMAEAHLKSPEFKKVFGDWESDPENASKIVDENGKPRIVYHGTQTQNLDTPDNPFNVYRGKRAKGDDLFGIFTTVAPEYASKYAEVERDYTEKENKSQGHVVPYYLNIKIPLRVNKTKLGEFLADLKEFVGGVKNAYDLTKSIIGTRVTDNIRLPEIYSLSKKANFYNKYIATPFNDIFDKITDRLSEHLYEERKKPYFINGKINKQYIPSGLNVELTNILKELGYDGVIYNDGFEIIAFDRNQLIPAYTNEYQHMAETGERIKQETDLRDRMMTKNTLMASNIFKRVQFTDEQVDNLVKSLRFHELMMNAEDRPIAGQLSIAEITQRFLLDNPDVSLQEMPERLAEYIDQLAFENAKEAPLLEHLDYVMEMVSPENQKNYAEENFHGKSQYEEKTAYMQKKFDNLGFRSMQQAREVFVNRPYEKIYNDVLEIYDRMPEYANMTPEQRQNMASRDAIEFSNLEFYEPLYMDITENREVEAAKPLTLKIGHHSADKSADGTRVMNVIGKMPYLDTFFRDIIKEFDKPHYRAEFGEQKSANPIVTIMNILSRAKKSKIVSIQNTSGENSVLKYHKVKAKHLKEQVAIEMMKNGYFLVPKSSGSYALNLGDNFRKFTENDEILRRFANETIIANFKRYLESDATWKGMKDGKEILKALYTNEHAISMKTLYEEMFKGREVTNPAEYFSLVKPEDAVKKFQELAPYIDLVKDKMRKYFTDEKGNPKKLYSEHEDPLGAVYAAMNETFNWQYDGAGTNRTIEVNGDIAKVNKVREKYSGVILGNTTLRLNDVKQLLSLVPRYNKNGVIDKETVEKEGFKTDGRNLYAPFMIYNPEWFKDNPALFGRLQEHASDGGIHLSESFRDFMSEIYGMDKNNLSVPKLKGWYKDKGNYYIFKNAMHYDTPVEETANMHADWFNFTQNIFRQVKGIVPNTAIKSGSAFNTIEKFSPELNMIIGMNQRGNILYTKSNEAAKPDASAETIKGVEEYIKSKLYQGEVPEFLKFNIPLTGNQAMMFEVPSHPASGPNDVTFGIVDAPFFSMPGGFFDTKEGAEIREMLVEANREIAYDSMKKIGDCLSFYKILNTNIDAEGNFKTKGVYHNNRDLRAAGRIISSMVKKLESENDFKVETNFPNNDKATTIKMLNAAIVDGKLDVTKLPLLQAYLPKLFMTFLNSDLPAGYGSILGNRIAKALDRGSKFMIPGTMMTLTMDTQSLAHVHHGLKYSFDKWKKQFPDATPDQIERQTQYYSRMAADIAENFINPETGLMKDGTNGIILSRDYVEIINKENAKSGLPQIDIGSRILAKRVPVDGPDSMGAFTLIGISEGKGTVVLNPLSASKIFGTDYDKDGITIHTENNYLRGDRFNKLWGYFANSGGWQGAYKSALEGLLAKETKIEGGKYTYAEKLGLTPEENVYTPQELGYTKTLLNTQSNVSDAILARTQIAHAFANIGEQEFSFKSKYGSEIVLNLRDKWVNKGEQSHNVIQNMWSYITNKAVDVFNFRQFNPEEAMYDTLISTVNGKPYNTFSIEAKKEIRKSVKKKIKELSGNALFENEFDDGKVIKTVHFALGSKVNEIKGYKRDYPNLSAASAPLIMADAMLTSLDTPVKDGRIPMKNSPKMIELDYMKTNKAIARKIIDITTDYINQDVDKTDFPEYYDLSRYRNKIGLAIFEANDKKAGFTSMPWSIFKETNYFDAEKPLDVKIAQTALFHTLKNFRPSYNTIKDLYEDKTTGDKVVYRYGKLELWSLGHSGYEKTESVELKNIFDSKGNLTKAWIRPEHFINPNSTQSTLFDAINYKGVSFSNEAVMRMTVDMIDHAVNHHLPPGSKNRNLAASLMAYTEFGKKINDETIEVGGQYDQTINNRRFGRVRGSLMLNTLDYKVPIVTEEGKEEMSIRKDNHVQSILDNLHLPKENTDYPLPESSGTPTKANKSVERKSDKLLKTDTDINVEINTKYNVRKNTGTKTNVWYGTNENAELSNLAERPFESHGLKFRSVEHAYQTLKTGSPDMVTYEKYLNAGPGCKIKGIGRPNTKNQANIQLMEELIFKSFISNPEAKEALLNTLGSEITHNQEKGIWNKKFPDLLETVRNELWQIEHRKLKQQNNKEYWAEREKEEQSKSTETKSDVEFTEDNSPGYKDRTMRNAASADATIAIAVDFSSAGEKLTKSSVIGQNKKYIPVDANGLKVTNDMIKSVVFALKSSNAKTLNIAGNGLYTMKGKYTQEQIDAFTYDLLKSVVNSPGIKIESIRSGGQTGFDEAGIKAGNKLGIPTIVLAPKGWKFRNIDGKDISNEKLFKDRFNVETKSDIAKEKPFTFDKDIEEYVQGSTDNNVAETIKYLNEKGYKPVSATEDGLPNRDIRILYNNALIDCGKNRYNAKDVTFNDRHMSINHIRRGNDTKYGQSIDKQMKALNKLRQGLGIGSDKQLWQLDKEQTKEFTYQVLKPYIQNALTQIGMTQKVPDPKQFASDLVGRWLNTLDEAFNMDTGMVSDRYRNTAVLAHALMYLKKMGKAHTYGDNLRGKSKTFFNVFSADPYYVANNASYDSVPFSLDEIVYQNPVITRNDGKTTITYGEPTRIRHLPDEFTHTTAPFVVMSPHVLDMRRMEIFNRQKDMMLDSFREIVEQELIGFRDTKGVNTVSENNVLREFTKNYGSKKMLFSMVDVAMTSDIQSPQLTYKIKGMGEFGEEYLFNDLQNPTLENAVDNLLPKYKNVLENLARSEGMNKDRFFEATGLDINDININRADLKNDLKIISALKHVATAGGNLCQAMMVHTDNILQDARLQDMNDLTASQRRGILLEAKQNFEIMSEQLYSGDIRKIFKLITEPTGEFGKSGIIDLLATFKSDVDTYLGNDNLSLTQHMQNVNNDRKALNEKLAKFDLMNMYHRDGDIEPLGQWAARQLRNIYNNKGEITPELESVIREAVLRNLQRSENKTTAYHLEYGNQLPENLVDEIMSIAHEQAIASADPTKSGLGYNILHKLGAMGFERPWTELKGEEKRDLGFDARQIIRSKIDNYIEQQAEIKFHNMGNKFNLRERLGKDIDIIDIAIEYAKMSGRGNIVNENNFEFELGNAKNKLNEFVIDNLLKVHRVGQEMYMDNPESNPFAHKIISGEFAKMTGKDFYYNEKYDPNELLANIGDKSYDTDILTPGKHVQVSYIMKGNIGEIGSKASQSSVIDGIVIGTVNIGETRKSKDINNPDKIIEESTNRPHLVIINNRSKRGTTHLVPLEDVSEIIGGNKYDRVSRAVQKRIEKETAPLAKEILQEIHDKVKFEQKEVPFHVKELLNNYNDKSVGLDVNTDMYKIQNPFGTTYEQKLNVKDNFNETEQKLANLNNIKNKGLAKKLDSFNRFWNQASSIRNYLGGKAAMTVLAGIPIALTTGNLAPLIAGSVGIVSRLLRSKYQNMLGVMQYDFRHSPILDITKKLVNLGDEKYKSQLQFEAFGKTTASTQFEEVLRDIRNTTNGNIKWEGVAKVLKAKKADKAFIKHAEELAFVEKTLYSEMTQEQKDVFDRLLANGFTMSELGVIRGYQATYEGLTPSEAAEANLNAMGILGHMLSYRGLFQKFEVVSASKALDVNASQMNLDAKRMQEAVSMVNKFLGKEKYTTDTDISNPARLLMETQRLAISIGNYDRSIARKGQTTKFIQMFENFQREAKVDATRGAYWRKQIYDGMLADIMNDKDVLNILAKKKINIPLGETFMRNIRKEILKGWTGGLVKGMFGKALLYSVVASLVPDDNIREIKKLLDNELLSNVLDPISGFEGAAIENVSAVAKYAFFMEPTFYKQERTKETIPSINKKAGFLEQVAEMKTPFGGGLGFETTSSIVKTGLLYFLTEAKQSNWDKAFEKFWLKAEELVPGLSDYAYIRNKIEQTTAKKKPEVKQNRRIVQ